MAQLRQPLNKKIQLGVRNSPARPLRIGFVPLADCAPVVVAQELGLYAKFGLRVELSRELGWATIRDKIVHRELEAAHALAAMPVAATLGLGSVPCDCVTALVLNLNGNAITLAHELWKRGVRDGQTLRAEVARSRRERKFVFGVVSPFSSHRDLLRRWLGAHGIDPERDVQIVVVPPPQMVANLRAGHLDGFCVGEPWNSLAVQARAGWITATSSEVDPMHPEKVLMVRADFAVERAAEHAALVAALLAACEFCDDRTNHESLIELLARPEYVGVDAAAIRRGITGMMDFGQGIERAVEEFCIFHRHDANEPSGDKAARVLDLVRASGLCPEPSRINFAFAKRIFRSDIFDTAVELRNRVGGNSRSQSEPELETAIA